MSRDGFTLIEVLAVVFLTSLVLGVALDFYTDLSRASNRAVDTTRDLRRATSILDRIARDLEAVILVSKPPEVDPLSHPWTFRAENRGSDLGADHVMFFTRNHHARQQEAHESDLALVAYLTSASERGDLELRRWSWPRLPESLVQDFPLAEDEGALLLADGIADFGMRFYAETGEWVDSWDSSQVVQSGQLPIAVEIEIALTDPDADPDAFLDVLPEDLPTYRRTVLLPLRPLDMRALLDPSAAAAAGEVGSEEEAEEEGIDLDGDGVPDDLDAMGLLTVGQCVNVAAISQASPALRDVFNQNINEPFDAVRNIPIPEYGIIANHPAVNPQCR